MQPDLSNPNAMPGGEAGFDGRAILEKTDAVKWEAAESCKRRA